MTKKATKTSVKEVVEPEIKEKNLGGRPTIYTDELANTILFRLAEGESLNKICQDDAMPNRSTIYEWCFTRLEFSNRYTKAREIQIDNKIDNMLDRVEDVPNKYYYFDEQGNKRIDSAGINLERLYQDSLKWCAIKLVPKKYGDRAGEDDAKKNDVADALQTVSKFIKDLPN